MSEYYEVLTDKKVEKGKISTAMSRIAGLRMRSGMRIRDIYDSGIINASDWKNLGTSEASTLISQTLSGDIQYHLDNRATHVAYVQRDEEKLGAVAPMRNEFGSPNSNPQTVVLAFGIENNLGAQTMDAALAQVLASYIEEESYRFAREATELIATNGMNTFKPKVCFEKLAGSYPTIEALLSHRVLETEVIPQLNTLSSKPSVMGQGYSDEMERLGNILQLALHQLPDHPLLQSLAASPLVQSAATHPMGNEYAMKTAKKTAKAMEMYLSALLKGLDRINEPMYPSIPNGPIKANQPTETESGSILLAFEDHGSNYTGSISFHADEDDSNAVSVEYNDIFPGSGRSAFMAAELLKAIEAGTWMRKQIQ